MPTFTAIALDRLIEPGDSNSNSMVPPRKPPNPNFQRRHSTPKTTKDRGIDIPSSKLRGDTVSHNAKFGERKNSSLTKAVSFRTDRKNHWTQISPALYATPESTPLPGSPSSYPPSPYIINHKRRGPRLSKSFSEDDVATCKRDDKEIEVVGNGNADENGVEDSVSKDDSFVSVKVQELLVEDKGMHSNGACNNYENGQADRNGVIKPINMQDDCEADAFVDLDPQGSMSVKCGNDPQGLMSVKCENDPQGLMSVKSENLSTPFAEFYDAWEELSSESPQLQHVDIEGELREMKFNLLMEIEKRKQAEETLYHMRNQWQIIREKLLLLGLTLPEDQAASPDGKKPDDHAAESLCQQVYLARFVSNSIGRGIAKAEAEMEMEAQIKMKNIEIARLWDRLHYYEAVNQEMSQRNQQVLETTRRLRQIRKRRQKWVWGSIAAAVTLGSGVLAYSYFYGGKTSSSSTHTPKVDRDTK